MLFEEYIYSSCGHFKYAKGKPLVRGREFHNYHEVVLFLGGEAQLISKNIQIKLSPNSLVLIPREHFHQFFVTDENNYMRCILGFFPDGKLDELASRVMDDVRVIPRPSEHIISVFEQLKRASKQGMYRAEKEILLDSAVAQILVELKMNSNSMIDQSTTASDITLNALEYIDEHYGKDISLQGIAEMLNVSVSLLSHHFKRDLNISVYKYITEKRLSMVRQLIERGVPLGHAAEMCGFRDYSGFYRLYKKQYGACPSEISVRERAQSR